jgi:prophage regulatory protein
MSQSIQGSTGLPASGFVRQRQLVPHVIPFSPATLWRKVKAGEFPSPVKLSMRVTAWRVEDIRAWMAAQTEQAATAANRPPVTPSL